VLHPGGVGVAAGRDAELMNASAFTLGAAYGSLSRSARLPAHVVVPAEPVGVVEGWVGEDVVGAEVGIEVVAEGVGVLGAEVGLDAAQGEVHDGEAAGGGVALSRTPPRARPSGSLWETKWALPPRRFVLAVDADVAKPAAVGFDECFRLHEHAAGAAARVVDAAFVGGEHFDEAAHDAGRM